MELERLVNRRVEDLPKGLRQHIYRVRDIAAELAGCHGLERPKAELAMLCHDVARAMPDGQLLDQAAGLGIPVTLLDRSLPVLLHGPVGAEILRREDGLRDEPIYQAVYWHTTAHPDLDTLGKVVFLADKLDPAKISRYPYLHELRELALRDLDQAILEFTTKEIVARAQQGEPVHPIIVETRNALLAASATG